jgi:hypothetical protein
MNGSTATAARVADLRPLLSFGKGNAKLDPAVFTFSLPAGHFCPYAEACRSQADRDTGHIQDGPNTEFRCFSATSEARARSVRNSRWRNAELLKGCRNEQEIVRLILASLSPYAGVVRLHVSGDFFNHIYLRAWLEVARQRPRTLFYGYTKALPLWVKHIEDIGTGYEAGRVENFVMTASYGGTHDHLIAEHGLRFAKVVYSPEEAEDLGLVLDKDDSHAMRHCPSFALLLHGTQPPGSAASKALRRLWQRGEFGYGERAEMARAAARRSLPMVA